MRRIAPHLRLIRRRSWGSNTLPFAGLIPSPGDDARFRDRPARMSFDQPVPAPTVFVGRLVHQSRMGLLATSGLDLPSKIRSTRFLEIDRSCLGLCPLAGLRTRRALLRGHHVSNFWRANIRGLVTAGDSSVPGPLVTGPSAPGFAAPFLRRCVRNLVRLHPLARSRFSLAPASPALQRFVRLTPRQSNRSEPCWNQLPV